MKNYKFLLLLIFTFSITGFAQNKKATSKQLSVNVLIDANKNIYVEKNLTPIGDIVKSIQKIIRNTPANKYEGVTYRIYADGSLQHGTIMDINQLLLEAYQPINTKIEKYLLDTKANNLDGSNWVKQLNKLDL
tara:strand:- start:8695 stop:9093 length:399 start_codon:yes stop_codon:yes gene_type:complete